MRAILLLFDETEHMSKVQPPGDPNGKAVCYDCSCVRNCTLEKAKRLIRYLRITCRLPKTDIAVLRSSRFVTGWDIEQAICEQMRKFGDDNLLFFYSGHGGTHYWYLGQSKVVSFQTINQIFHASARRNLAIIADCCHALALDAYLTQNRKLLNRYLLIGSSEAKNLSCVGISLVHPICEFWQLRTRADIRVAKTEKIGGRTRLVDIAFRGVKIPGENPNCPNNEVSIGRLAYCATERPSLRRGSDIDEFFFPPPR